MQHWSNITLFCRTYSTKTNCFCCDWIWYRYRKQTCGIHSNRLPMGLNDVLNYEDSFLFRSLDPYEFDRMYWCFFIQNTLNFYQPKIHLARNWTESNWMSVMMVYGSNTSQWEMSDIALMIGNRTVDCWFFTIFAMAFFWYLQINFIHNVYVRCNPMNKTVGFFLYWMQFFAINFTVDVNATTSHTTIQRQQRTCTITNSIN